MIPILSREQMRSYDALAINECAVPGVILMENAGRGAAEIIANRTDGGPVAILCGRGNNGGDGFVVARHLLARGIAAEVYVVGESAGVGGDASINLHALIGLGGKVTFVTDDIEPIREALLGAALCVDGLFGTGLSRPIEGRWLEVIAAINNAACPCVALDIPSGIDADTGAVLGDAVSAELTVTFGHLKAGLCQGPGSCRAGEVVVTGLGLPDASILEKVGYLASVIEPSAVAAALGRRANDAHKYRNGSVLVLAGSAGKVGAAQLTARAVLRSGAGIATIGSWPDAIATIEGGVTEVMTARIEPDAIATGLERALDRRAAVAIGPGLGLDERARELCEQVVLHFGGPAVVDADAISCFAARAEALREAAGPRVLTPHAGELGRLLGISSVEVEQHRFEAARRASEVTGATVLLKGPNTVIASNLGATIDVCAFSNPLLATAGSGDVLTGVIAALLCHAGAREAACAGAYLHALAADIWRDEVGADRGMLAGEIAEAIPQAIASFNRDQE